MDLKEEVQKLLFEELDNPLTISEHSVRFQFIMSCFRQYEKQVSACTIHLAVSNRDETTCDSILCSLNYVIM